MKIKEICEHSVVTMSSEQSVVDAAKLMRHHHVGDVIVVGEGTGQPIPLGIVTDRDLVIGILAQEVDDPRRIKASDITSRTLHTVHEDDELSSAMKSMWTHGVRRMPVVNDEGTLVGVVTYDDLVRRLAEELAEAARMMPRQRRREAKNRT